LCGRKCNAPLFDPYGDLCLDHYLKMKKEWEDEVNARKQSKED
jgi:hypothetical protein